VSIFIDQLLGSHYREEYPNFAELYPIPKLLAHSFCGHALPSWLIYSNHGYDRQADWNKINLFASRAKKVVHQFLLKTRIGRRIEFDKILAKEIRTTFEEQHQTKLLDAFDVANITDQVTQQP
jgi:hypothetical protein